MSLVAKKIFDGVFEIKDHLATENLVLGEKVYGEELITINGTEYRWWNPFRSKIAAGIKKGLKSLPIKKGSKILYLGSAEGTTISHLSDITGEKGLIFGLDINAKVMQKFLYLCEKRKNLFPILADANKPESYRQFLGRGKVDFLFQDISQKNQSEIFLKNCRAYLKRGKTAMLSLKVRSISQAEDYKKILTAEKKKLEKELKIIETLELSPFEKDHALIVCEKK